MQSGSKPVTTMRRPKWLNSPMRPELFRLLAAFMLGFYGARNVFCFIGESVPGRSLAERCAFLVVDVVASLAWFLALSSQENER